MSELNRSIIVTGGSSGLGYHATTSLARRFANSTIIIASRSDSNSAVASIRQNTKHNDIHFLPLDLGSLKSVRDFVAALSARGIAPISILLLNAAMQFPDGLKYTIDGIEATFGINHVGHALLFHLLQPLLAEKARIVVTASAAHDPAQKTGVNGNYTSAEELAHPTGDALKYTGMDRYATSKLCNVLWVYALNRRLLRLPTKKWTVVAFDPGMMPGTGLAREAGPMFRFFWGRVLPKLIPLLRRVLPFRTSTVEESGADLAWVASEDSTSGVNYEARNPIKSSLASHEEPKQEDLWMWTVKNVAVGAKELEDFELAYLVTG